MTKKTDTQETNETDSGLVGIRVKLEVTQEAWLTKMSELTGMTKGELLSVALDMLRDSGREFLANAIMQKAEAIRNSLLNS